MTDMDALRAKTAADLEAAEEFGRTIVRGLATTRRRGELARPRGPQPVRLPGWLHMRVVPMTVEVQMLRDPHSYSPAQLRLALRLAMTLGRGALVVVLEPDKETR